MYCKLTTLNQHSDAKMYERKNESCTCSVVTDHYMFFYYSVIAKPILNLLNLIDPLLI